MKRPRLVLLLCLLAGLLAWWMLRDEGGERLAETHESSKAMSSQAVNAPASPQSNSAQNDGVVTAANDDKTGIRYKRAYMLSLDQGALALVQAQDIEGDFAPRRGKDEEWTGMLRCRLLSAGNDILAEELLPAPDHVCAVLDPRSEPGKPVRYATPGPVVFQVRMPRVKGASRLDIFRILRPGEPAVENLLGSLPLPPS